MRQKPWKPNIKFEKRNRQKPLIQFQLFIFYETRLFTEKFSRTTTIHPGIFREQHYLNNRVFLSRNYRLIVAQRKFNVLKTNICPRSEPSRANMLVLRTSNFQGATIRPIVPRQTLYCLYCSPLNFIPNASSKITYYTSIELFSRFWVKSCESQI